MDHLPQTLQRHREHLGEGRRRAVRCRPTHHCRHRTSGGRLLLDRGQPLRALRPGQGRRRELPRLRRRPRRRSERSDRRTGCPRPDGHRGREGIHLRSARSHAEPHHRGHQRPRPRIARRLPTRHRHRGTRTPDPERQQCRGLGHRLVRRGPTCRAAARRWWLRDACRGERRARPGSLRMRFRGELRHRAVPQGRQTRVHDQQQGRRPVEVAACRCRIRRSGDDRVGPRRRSRLRGHLVLRRHGGTGRYRLHRRPGANLSAYRGPAARARVAAQ